MLAGLAESGDEEALYELGVMHRQGEGVIADAAQAAKYWEAAAMQKHPLAEYNLGTLYLKGEGVAENRARGLDYLERAARQGVSAAAYKLALLLLWSMGGTERRNEWEQWLRQAAKSADPDALFLFAALHFAQGESQNSSEGLKEIGRLLGRAALHLHPGALFVVREAMESGVGLEQNPVAQCLLIGAAVRFVRLDLEESWRSRLAALAETDARRVLAALENCSST
jgi:TPR repeat protein